MGSRYIQKEKIVPENFNAVAYLGELMQQLPGQDGRYELSRQLAAAVGRANPWSHAYIRNLYAGRQKMTPGMRRALYHHSIGIFSKKPQDSRLLKNHGIRADNRQNDIDLTLEENSL